MVKIRTKYIILFWILLLILFTFYCIFRIKYISDKTQEKYANLPFPKSSSGDVIDWANNINKTGIITDIQGCEYVYDDNIGVGVLGYSDCQSAYTDYVNKGFDVDETYGQSKSLSDMCPVSTKSPLYASCLKQLSYKFTNNANIIDNVNSEVTNLLNTRLSERNAIVNSISSDMNSFIYGENQNDFNSSMNSYNAVAKNPDDVFNLVGNYYGNRFKTDYGIGYSKSIEGFADSPLTTNQNIVEKPIISQSTVDLFFGHYTPLTGQFLVLDTISMILGYDVTENTQQQNNVILTITNTDGFQLNAKVDSINKFKNTINSIILRISDINVINNPSNSQTLQQLLSILGVNQLTYLIITYEEYTSSEKVLHKTYKLVNDNLDTIILLNKT